VRAFFVALRFFAVQRTAAGSVMAAFELDTPTIYSVPNIEAAIN
jgi:hypothetical protein